MAEIAFFSSRKTYEESICSFLQELGRYASIKLFVCDDFREVTEMYKKVEEEYDGFLFSGWILYAMVTTKYKIDKPHLYFYPSEGDFYRTLLKACAENPSVPMNHILVDMPENGLAYEDVMPPENHCIYPDLDGLPDEQIYPSDPEQVIRHFGTVAMNAYEKAVLENKVEILVSGYPGMEKFCSKRNIKLYHLNAGKETLVSGIKQLLNYINSGHYSHMLSVYGIVKTPEEQLDMVEKKISNYVLLRGFFSMVYRREGSIRLVLTSRDFNRITKNSEDCLISRELIEQNITDFYIGWGVGYDITKAHDNAKKALQTARHCVKGSSMLVNEAGVMIGPLLHEEVISVSANDDSGSIALSNKLDISRLNLKRIQAVIRKSNNNQFTSLSLAKELDISQRNARRILTKLLEHGGAELVEPQEDLKRGRPELIYKIHLR